MPGAGSTNVPGVRVEESDGSPSGFASKLVFPNGSLGLSGSTGTVSFAPLYRTANRAGTANAAETDGMTVTASSTLFGSILDSNDATLGATESAHQRRIAFACTIKKFAIRYETNPHTTADTWTLRVNGADQGTPLSVSAGATGLQVSAAQSVSVAAGDLVCIKVVGGATSNATCSIIQAQWQEA